MRIEEKAIDTIRVLTADAVQQAGSGHPGMPMGGADFAFTLWNKFFRFNPENPSCPWRDRFVLSTGHGSMLQYALLHLFECGLPLDEIKKFRTFGSLTPAHPEFGHTKGVDVTTGPLGSGFASAVGMAMAAKQLKARMGNSELFEQRVFTILGDGCQMEGCASEAASLAGHLKLNNFIAFYDDNQITIEGSTELAFTENVAARYESYGWKVLFADGHNVDELEKAIAEAVAEQEKPTLIIGRTTIGKGAPNKQGTSSVHGSPLGADEVTLMKEALGFPKDEHFYISDDVRTFCQEVAAQKVEASNKYDAAVQEFFAANADKKELYEVLTNKTVPANLLEELLNTVTTEKAIATRASSGECIQKISELVPAFAGGSADLAPSCKTNVSAETSFSADNYAGRNFHYGVREFAMALCANGQALYDAMLPYTSTFFVFSDYLKPAIRLAALQNLKQAYVFTHDSFYVGEDGPTHQPIEQIAMLRSIPNLTVIRPADGRETAHAWNVAVNNDGPTALLLSRQNLPQVTADFADKVDVAKGAYVAKDSDNFDAVIMATGSEVSLAVATAEALAQEGINLRVVSMPSWELFEKQSAEYQEAVLPTDCKKRISIEAASTFGWDKYTCRDGLKIGVDHFGLPGSDKALAEEFGFTVEKISAKIKAYLG